MHWPQRLQVLRWMSGLSMREAARHLGMRFGQYMALERGEGELTLGTAHLIASFYDIPLEGLFSGPLPVPRHFSTPVYPEDDMDELALLIREAQIKLWRMRQAYDEPWEQFVKRLSVRIPPIPFPYGKLRLPNSAVLPEGVGMWLDLPHKIKAADSEIAVRWKGGRYRFPRRQDIILPSGYYTFSAIGPSTTLYVVQWCHEPGRPHIPDG